MKYTQQEAIDKLWSAKGMYLTDSAGNLKKGGDGLPIANPDWCNVYLYATLARDALMTNPGKPDRTAPIGTTVLVTMISRFGDVGIRDRNLSPPSNGYDCRVQPEALTDWRDKP